MQKLVTRCSNTNELRRHCHTCYATVESTLRPAFNTRYVETILCPVCGADNSLKPSFLYRWRQARRLMKKNRKIFGLAWPFHVPPVRLFQVPYPGPRKRA